MFNNNDPPVSLFSFQDIITSLTGIMIFFLLLLSLNIIEMMKKTQEESPLAEELKQVQKINTVLQQQIQEIEQDIRTYKERLHCADGQDETTLLEKQAQLEKQLRRKKAKKENCDSALADAEKEYGDQEKENAEWKAKQQQAEQKEKRNRAIREQIENQREKNVKIREEITKRKNRILITLDSAIDKDPLLIECSKDKICILDYRQQTRKTFQRSSPIAADMINAVISYLKKFPVSRYYFVFMLKPSAATFMEYLNEKLEKDLKGAETGFEPILESEGISNE